MAAGVVLDTTIPISGWWRLPEGCVVLWCVVLETTSPYSNANLPYHFYLTDFIKVAGVVLETTSPHQWVVAFSCWL